MVHNKHIKTSIIFIVIVFTLFLTIVDSKADNIPITYLSYVDNAYGFYRVIDLTTHKPSPYDNRTLIINQGDTVTWINDADNAVLTIVSEQNLFGDKRLDIRQRSSYTFNQIGTYNFYIREYLGRRQTIIVNAIDTDIYPTIIPTYNIDTPTVTENTPIPTKIVPIHTAIIPTATIPSSSSTNSSSITQIMSIIVAMLSIFITYKIGKGGEEFRIEKYREDYKGIYKKIEKEKRDNIKYEQKFSSGIKYSQKISGVLCYLLGFLSGMFFIIISRKENKFVRFHAIQSTITSLSMFIILLILTDTPSIGDIFGPLLIIIGPIIWILLMIKAFQGKIYKLPIIGDVAERYC